ncbi:MAG: tRNA uridine-5-carboxymethylaminomethyl(34) synthesis GTPase MnmE [Desulfobacterales bacterium]|jgi:tRNA modification GTPase
MDNSTIAAIATPGGRGGIGIIKLSGPRAVSIATTIFSPAESKSETIHGKTGPAKDKIRDGLQSHRLYLGHIIDPENRRVIDEVLLCVMKAPRSYTKEDVVEINAHGGQVAVNAILELVLRQGGQIAEPGEFTKRAFLNGRIDLTQAEAVIDIINARTDKSLKAAAAQIKGQLKTKVEQIRQFMIAFLARVEGSIDFPDEVEDIVDSKAAIAEIKACVIKPLQQLVQHYLDGNTLRRGLKVVVVGRPNVGKSSLLNRLLQSERAIVTALPGTTRDTIEETLNIRGFPIVLVDTAGLHDSADPIEILGIKKTMDNIDGADLIIFMVEANRPLTAEDHNIFSKVKSKPFIIALNKIDLVNGENSVVLPDSWMEKDRVKISALYDRGLEKLKEKMVLAGFGEDPIDIETAIVPNLRQKLLMEDSLRTSETIIREIENDTPMELIAISLQEAIDSLGQVLGTHVKVDVLDQIFSRFCIGK